MLCCVSRKASARSSSESNEKQQKPVDTDCSGSTSGFSESSSASSGDFPSSGFTATSSSSFSSSGFSSGSPASICAFVNTSTESSSSGFEFSDRFDLSNDYLGNSLSITKELDVRGSSSFYSPVPPKRLQTFSPAASLQYRLNSDGNGESIVEKEKSAEDEPPVLLPCAICERTFKPDSLEKHTRICERSAFKKRKPFDSAKQRIQGTELAEFLPKETVKRKVYLEEKPVIPTASKASWKQTHDEFVKTIRAARGETTEAPTQRQAVAQSQVTVGVPTRPNEKGMCPTCNRQFSIKAYERHVAWCKEHATRVPIIPTTNIAKERLEARMKYRAPMLKNRRITNREKYAPGSAANLTNCANKNSMANQRAKESVSTPNCNNKSGNENAIGASNQSHQKSTSNSRRSGQGREGMPSGPMKSRLSDRSNRPTAEIDYGNTTKASSCPIPSRINRHSRLSPTRALLPSYSPFPTSRSSCKSESIRMSSQDIGSCKKFFGHDRKAIELNIFNAAKHHRQNIVSARSCGYPRINDVTINDEIDGMTVQRCGYHENDEGENSNLITWKQISEDKNLVKEIKFLNLNDQPNFDNCVENIRVPKLEPIVQNKGNLKSRIASTNSVNRGTKSFNQTCLITESLDEEKNLSKILDRRMRRSLMKSPRTGFCHDEGRRKNDATDVDSDAMSLNRFNADVNVTSSPLHSRGRDNDGYEENNSRIVSPLLSGQGQLVPLDLKMIHDEDSDFEDTSRSGRSTTFSVKTCCRKLTKRSPKLKSINDGEKLIRGNLLSCSDFGVKNCEILKDSRHSFEDFDDIGFGVNNEKELLENSRSLENIENLKDRELAKNTSKVKAVRREEFDAERQLSFSCCNEENGSKHCEESSKINGEEINNFGKFNRTVNISRSMELKIENRNDLDDYEARNKLITSRSSLLNSKNEDHLDFRIHDEENTKLKHFSKSLENIEIIDSEENNQLPITSRSSLLNSKNDDHLDFRIHDEENTKLEHFSKSLENIEKIDSEENNQLLITSRSLEITPKNTCHKIVKKKVSKTLPAGDKQLICYKNTSESLDEINYPKLINFPRSARSEVIAIKKCLTKTSKEPTELFVNNNSRCEKNDDINRTYICDESELPKIEMKNYCTESPKNKFSCSLQNLFDTTPENNDQSLVKLAEFSADLDSEKVKKSVIEQPKNYKRCGTYVIERATNSNSSSKHTASDESLEEKPTVKRRKIEQDTIFNEIKNSPISNIITDETRRDLKVEEKNSTVKSAKIVSNDRGFHEINEKYKNENFDYESDNTADNNLMKNDNETEASITVEENFSTADISIYDLHPKAHSDSILSRETNSLISSSKAKKKNVEPSAEVTKKLKKKMSLLRGSTDNLISSVEASSKLIDKKSSCKNEKTPRVEKETIRKIDFTAIEKIEASKTIGCSYLPKIPVERINARNADRKDSKFRHLDVDSFWRKSDRNSSARLINLDPPISREIKMRNSRLKTDGNLPPVVPVALRKERRRDAVRDSRGVWNNYVRRRPDFNLVLTGRIGTFKDYDPFLLAERQMNDLLSDTCSDQSFTDSPGDHRKSSSPNSHNYPLSHSSAFVKYPNPVTRNLNNSEKRASLIAPPSEFDDLTADFSSDSTETNSISREILADLEDSRVRENGMNHEGKSKDARDHVLGRRVIIDKSKALGTTEIIDDSGRKNLQSNEKARKIIEKITPKVVKPHVTRSSSVRANSAPKAPERKNNNSSINATNKMNSRSSPGSGLNNRNNNYASLNGSNMSLSSIVSSEADVKRSNSLFDELASSFEDDASGIYPSLRSLLKNDSLSISSPVQSNRSRNGQISDEELSSPENYQRHDQNKLSADSAYSSLNRKYSNHGRSTNDMAGRLDEDSPQRRRDGDPGTTSSAKSSKMSKFCHECGCKFPETAKFCCECGIRRLTL